jgi:tight adherence protein C
MNAVLLALFFGTVMGAVWLAGYFWLRASQSASAADPMVASSEEDQAGLMVALSRTFFRLGESLPLSGKQENLARQRLARAGFRSPSATTIFAGSRVGVAFLAGLALFWVASSRAGVLDALVPALCGAGVGYLAPERWLDWKIRRRAGQVRRGLCTALDLMTMSIEAGQSLDAAMLDTARSLWRSYPALCEDLVFCHLEMKAGKSRTEALTLLGQRSAEEEVAKVAAILIDGERFGTSLGPALRTHSKFLRSKLRFAAQESARKLTVKLVMPVFFLIFPSVLLVTLGPAYLQLQQFFQALL